MLWRRCVEGPSRQSSNWVPALPDSHPGAPRHPSSLSSSGLLLCSSGPRTEDLRCFEKLEGIRRVFSGPSCPGLHPPSLPCLWAGRGRQGRWGSCLTGGCPPLQPMPQDGLSPCPRPAAALLHRPPRPRAVPLLFIALSLARGPFLVGSSFCPVNVGPPEPCP